MIFSCSIGLYPGHAPANFAYASVLSEKLHFTRFSQVPAGSDYPCYSPIRQENMLLFYKLFSSIKKVMKESFRILSAFSSEEKACHGARSGMAGNGAANHEGLNLRLRIAFQNLLL